MGTCNSKVNVESEESHPHSEKGRSDIPEILKKNLRPIMIFTGVILTGVVFFSIASFVKKSAMNKESDLAYFTLKGNDGRIGSLSALEMLNGHYREKGASPDSVRLASLFFHDGKVDESLELYKNISENGQDNITKSIGLLGLGYSLEAKGQFKEAMDKFKQIRTIAILKDYQYLAALSVARCYEELSDKKKALEEYNQIEKEFKEFLDKDFIKSRVSALSS